MNRRNKSKSAHGQSDLPQQMNVDLSSAENIFCSRCGNFAFIPAVTFKKLSALLSPTGNEGVVPVETFMCSNCGYIPPEFMPVPVVTPEGGITALGEGVPEDYDELIEGDSTDHPSKEVTESGLILSTNL